MDYNINFPNLHIYLDNVGKNIMIGDFTIAYYGMIIAVGMMGAIMLAIHLAKKTGQDSDKYYDLAIIAIISAIIGARLYFVAFQWDYYSQDLTRIFNIREGGLAIYGGILAAIIAVCSYAKFKKMEIGPIADVAGPAVAFGQCVGRWGNFFNREAFGGYTDNLFAMQLPVSAVRSGEITQELRENIVFVDGISYIQVHPTFLYESLWNLGVLIFLLCYMKHRKFNGEVFLLYLASYGAGRFWIESLRTDQLLIPNTDTPVSQVLAAVMVVVAVVWIVVKRKTIKKEKSQEELLDNR
ncbi:MAG: prolipoprotein diacylglyceryl transferase [Agathobacter sp.]|nr:prolipoprotein diacylglyceryl transferase [Agathobacter sp.]